MIGLANYYPRLYRSLLCLLLSRSISHRAPGEYSRAVQRWTLIHRATPTPQINPRWQPVPSGDAPTSITSEIPDPRHFYQRGRNATRSLGDHIRIGPRGFFSGALREFRKDSVRQVGFARNAPVCGTFHQKTWRCVIFMLFLPYRTSCVVFFNYFALYNVGWKIVQSGRSEWQGIITNKMQSKIISRPFF